MDLPKESTNETIPIIPVNIQDLHWITKNSNGDYELNNQELEYLEIVCRVDKIQESGLKYTLKLRDECGKFTAFIYKNRHDTFAGYPFIPKTYATIIGKYTGKVGQDALIIERIRHVTTVETVVNHRLHLIWYNKYRQGDVKRSNTIEFEIRNKIVAALDKANPRGDSNGSHKDYAHYFMTMEMTTSRFYGLLDQMKTEGIVEEGITEDHFLPMKRDRNCLN